MIRWALGVPPSFINSADSQDVQRRSSETSFGDVVGPPPKSESNSSLVS